MTQAKQGDSVQGMAAKNGKSDWKGVAAGMPVPQWDGNDAWPVDEGSLVDPLDVESIAAGMRSAATLPVPCTAAVEVARRHDLALQAARVEAVLQRVVEAGRRPPR